MVENQIYIKTDISKIEMVRIMDSLGKVIKIISPINENAITLNLETLNYGIYFADIILQNQVRTVKKIIKF